MLFTKIAFKCGEDIAHYQYFKIPNSSGFSVLESVKDENITYIIFSKNFCKYISVLNLSYSVSSTFKKSQSKIFCILIFEFEAEL